MTVRKTLLALATTTVMSAPAWMLPGQALSHPFGPHTATPNNITNPGAKHRSDAANDAIKDKADKGKRDRSKPDGKNPGSHKCKPHKVAYVASGTLESWSLTENTDGTYSGSVTVVVKHTNHHAAGDKSSTPKAYKVENVRLTFGLPDTDKDGKPGTDDLAKGDSVKLIGKISTLAKKCSHTGFTPTITARHIVFHGPTA